MPKAPAVLAAPSILGGDANISIVGAWALQVGVPEEVLDATCSAIDPAAKYSPAFQDKRWDGRVRMWQGDKFPAGLADDVAGACRARGIVVEVKRPEVPKVNLARFNEHYLDGITLWPHQVESIIACLTRLSGVIRVPTGGGKGEVIVAVAKYLWEEFGWKSLIVVPKKGLAQQSFNRCKKYVGTDIKIGLLGDSQRIPGNIVAATAQTLLAAWPRERNGESGVSLLPVDPMVRDVVVNSDIILGDECFPANARVDGRPISTVRVGDTVEAFDPVAGVFSMRLVTWVFQRKPAGLVTVFLTDGRQVVCTPEHPFLTSTGWVVASRLRGCVVAVNCKHAVSGDMRCVREGGDQEASMVGSTVDVSGVSCGSKTGQVEVADPALYALPDSYMAEASAGCICVSQGATVLHSGLSPSLVECALVSDGGFDQPSVGVCTDEGEEPDAISGCSGESIADTTSHRAPPEGAGRERARANRTTMQVGQRVRSGGRACDLDEETTGVRVPNELQSGSRTPDFAVGRGGGRVVALRSGTQAAGREEGRAIAFVGVDRVEVHQPGSDGTFGGRCPDGAVYNLEVEGLNTYQVGGVVVHNCHHASSISWNAIFYASRAKARLGFSGTPLKDSVMADLTLRAVTGPVIYNVESTTLINLGINARPRIAFICADNASGARLPVKPRKLFIRGKVIITRSQGAYADIYRQAVVESDEHNATIMRSVLWLADRGRKVLLICRHKAHWTVLRKALVESGIEHMAIWGASSVAERERAKDYLNKGKIGVLLASSLPAHELLVLREGGRIYQSTIGDVTARFMPAGAGAARAEGVEVLSVDKKGVAAFRRMTAVHRHRLPPASKVVACTFAGHSGLRVEVTDNHSLVDVPAWTNVRADSGGVSSVLVKVDLPMDGPTYFDVPALLADDKRFFAELEGFAPPHFWVSGRRSHAAYFAHRLYGAPPPKGHIRQLRAMRAAYAQAVDPVAAEVYLRGLACGAITHVWSGAAGRTQYRIDLRFAAAHMPALLRLGTLYVRGRRAKSRIPARVPLDATFAEFLGLFVAEGCVCVNPSTTLSVVAAVATNPAVRRGGDAFMRSAPHNRALAVRVFTEVLGCYAQETAKRVVCASNVVGAFLLAVGVGKLAVGKQVPSAVFTAPVLVKQAFLRGLYFGDGSCNTLSHPLIVDITVSPRLAQGVNVLLRSLGEMRVSVRRNTPKGYQPCYYTSSPDGSVAGFGAAQRRSASGRAYYDDTSAVFGDVMNLKATVSPVDAPRPKFVYDVSVEGVENFVAGVGLAVAHNTIFDEGEDCPGIDALVLAEGVKVNTNVIQRIGRALRKKPGENTAWIVDIVPLAAKKLIEHADERCRLYEKEGYEVRLVTEWPKLGTKEDPANLLPFEVWDAK
jgi:superfamily II DNA or RNA helicase